MSQMAAFDCILGPRVRHVLFEAVIAVPAKESVTVTLLPLAAALTVSALESTSVKSPVAAKAASLDRKSAVQGKSVDLGGRRIIKKKRAVIGLAAVCGNTP